MSSITFDTQELVSELRTSGIPQEQAEAVVRAIVKSHNELATKADLRELGLSLTVRVGAMLMAAVGILIAVLKFPH